MCWLQHFSAIYCALFNGQTYSGYRNRVYLVIVRVGVEMCPEARKHWNAIKMNVATMTLTNLVTNANLAMVMGWFFNGRFFHSLSLFFVTNNANGCLFGNYFQFAYNQRFFMWIRINWQCNTCNPVLLLITMRKFFTHWI